jgi:hypothetical protein
MPLEGHPAAEEPLLLAVSFYFPPAPQASGLRAQELLAGCGLPGVLLRGYQPGAALLPVVPAQMPYVPLAELLVAREHQLGKRRFRAWLGWVRSEPGTWREWVELASRACLRHLALSGRRPQVVVSFGPPTASHQAGGSLAESLGLPWVAVCGPGEETEQAEVLAGASLLLLDGPSLTQLPGLAASQAHILPPGPKAAGVFKELILQAASEEMVGKVEET